ncbi:MAG: hypothetical protein KatS3mg104_2199 [Phycisphaerae bacterium]|nr:MAG: hypothetical protein KatS3mg104_2199 [Phycisphaerae bacterium]
MFGSKITDNLLLHLRMRKLQPQHRFGNNRRRRWILLGLIFAWPGVVLLGLVLNHVVGSPAPLSGLPVVGLIVLAFVIDQTHAEP